MIVYAVATNNGDGSMGIEFFDDIETIEFLEDVFPEDYGTEGYYPVLDIDLDRNPNIEIVTMAGAQERYVDRFGEI